jgi:hypothetical protein
VLRVEIDPSFTWLEDPKATVSTEIVGNWLTLQRGMRRKDQIWKDVVYCGPLGTTRFSTLVNLMVNYDALTGKWGPALAKFLAVMGIGASHVTMSGTEDWVVLFDPTKILRWQRVSTEESEWELPSVRGRI